VILNEVRGSVSCITIIVGQLSSTLPQETLNRDVRDIQIFKLECKHLGPPGELCSFSLDNTDLKATVTLSHNAWWVKVSSSAVNPATICCTKCYRSCLGMN